MEWIKNLLRNFVVRAGIKPLGTYFIDLLEEKAEATETEIDDAGVRVLKEIIDAEDYSIQSILLAAGKQLIIEADSSETVLDDLAGDLICAIGEDGDFTTNGVLRNLIDVLSAYSDSTDNMLDDFAVDALETIFETTGLIK